MQQSQLAGIGLRPQHYQDILEGLPELGWLEVHPENYFGLAGLPHFYLTKISQHYPISFHGIGMSLGSAAPLNMDHLCRLKQLIQEYQPIRVSEHMSFSTVPGQHLHDLLPMVYNPRTLARFCDKVKQAQDYLGVQLSIENPSSYLQFQESNIPEWEFYAQLPHLSECALLLDVNNVYVTCENHGYDAHDYLKNINPHSISEYHLAGHTLKSFDDGQVIIDDHGSKVTAEVWALFEKTIALLGAKPTLIEWDTQIPELVVLKQQRHIAQTYLVTQ